MAVKVHIHRYIRAVGRITNRNKDSGLINYYRCADAECSHYLSASLVLGKRSICNRCGKEFTLPFAIRGLTNRPHCKGCTKVPKRRFVQQSVQPNTEIEYEVVNDD